ncbi:PBSX family phage terminase large subunit [Paraclostridium ghonii]|uniref:Phage terminase large subunit n=1 Tax=Paraclostridium ghonii TaxID=29358 RepID=A0ABU0MX66_9FIRM|nr:PBSX family phage terminase large subunit [Paeniclostridium ghonii]MDQ0555339.1 phage terminase large subunit [Paeniclostridium ghonii]
MFNPVYLPQLEQYEKRFNIYYGGGGSGKSKFVVQKMIYKYLIFSNRKCLVVRKVTNSLRDSIFAEFKTCLADWKIYDRCKIRDTLLTIELPNGSQFIFKGVDDPEKIKSISGIDDIVIEEATELSLDDFSQLNLRLRSKNPYNQVHVMFNPISKSNWVYSQWFKNGYNKESTMVLHTTYKDNKFLPKDYIESLKEMESKNSAYYKIYALGEFATLDKLIFSYKKESFDYREIKRENKNTTAIFGLDFGYTNDPTAFVCSLIDRKNKKLYIFDEFQERGLTNEDIYKCICEKGYSKEKIVCDSAEPKSIEELYRIGLTRVKHAVKGRDSIINGIQYLQQFDIIVHPSCIHIIEEFNNYTWQKDKNGIYINKPIDKYNHGIDALRYSISTITNNKVKLLDRNLLF